ncbi:MAG TPA: acyl-CoA dehydrogenase family protein [Acidimicrobiales bacterium]|nr:acyl-CoA dehydrogenase family protein [Acidimicrobiales bacterium]
MASYLSEPVDSLPFNTADKTRRYATERYQGAAGLNWYRCDPTLQAAMRRHLGDDALAWAEPHLDRIGELMGGPIAERAEITDKNPPRLEKYDRWGHDISRVVMPQSFEESKAELRANSFGGAFREEARKAGVDSRPLDAAWIYMLCQAEIGMYCALGTGGDMVVRLVEDYAPDDIKARVRELMTGEALAGEASQMLTERTGGSDLAALETTAVPDGDAWRLSGFKWFASNANGSAFVVLAKPEGAPDGARGIASFLVLWDRRDGSRNGIRLRRLKDKLGTNAVASAEVEFVDAEAFLLAPSGPSDGSTPAAATNDGQGLSRMMQMTNASRLGIAMMGLGVARRAMVEAMRYAEAREAFGAPLAAQPLMQRKIAELIVEVEAAQALCFDGYMGPARLRIGAPLIKLFAARLGITAASDAIEVHGGNGYIEQWPVARLLRDAQVNTIWEGADNILCLDVRRAIEREDAHVPFLDRLRTACAAAPDDDETAVLVRRRIDELEAAIERWRALERAAGEARLYPLSKAMADVYAAALLVEAAAWESSTLGSDRKALVARLFARDHLAERDPLAVIDEPAEEIDRFKELWDGALVDAPLSGGQPAPTA